MITSWPNNSTDAKPMDRIKPILPRLRQQLRLGNRSEVVSALAPVMP
jgi:hypothetical protein